MLDIEKYGNILVVDSRLIAIELDILHRSFKDTITKFTPRLERLNSQGFDPDADGIRHRLLKKTAPKNSDGTGGETYYLLTEAQATVLMTLSANSEQVVEAKFALVEAFEKAKATIKQLLSQDSEVAQLKEMMQQIMIMFQEQGKQIDEMRAELKSTSEAKKQYPAIDKLVVNMNFVFIPAGLKEPFSAVDYLEKIRGLHLDVGLRRSWVNQISH